MDALEELKNKPYASRTALEHAIVLFPGSILDNYLEQAKKQAATEYKSLRLALENAEKVIENQDAEIARLRAELEGAR